MREPAFSGLLLVVTVAFALAATVFFAVQGAGRSKRIGEDLLRLQDTTAQIRVRGAIVLLIAFPLAGSLLLRGDVKRNGGPADIAPRQVLLVPKEET